MMASRKVIILAIDASKQAQDACDFYLTHLHKPDNVVVLVHMVDISSIPQSTGDNVGIRDLLQGPDGKPPDLLGEQGTKAEKLERTYKRYLHARGVMQVKSRTDGGVKPGEMICEVAYEEDASMIVIGTRGMGKIRRTLLGSVSDYVLHHATCPVVVCRQTPSGKAKLEKT